MTIDRLREIRRTQPFRRFTLRTADGTNRQVARPESLACDPVGRTVVRVSPDRSSHYIDPLLVARIDVSNGARRGRIRRQG